MFVAMSRPTLSFFFLQEVNRNHGDETCVASYNSWSLFSYSSSLCVWICVLRVWSVISCMRAIWKLLFQKTLSVCRENEVYHRHLGHRERNDYLSSSLKDWSCDMSAVSLSLNSFLPTCFLISPFQALSSIHYHLISHSKWTHLSVL